MEIRTEDFKKALKRCVIAVAPRPGIYTPDAIQADGEHLYAFNDVMGVKVKFKMPTIFSVSGVALTKLVDSFTGDALSLEVTPSEVHVTGKRNGRSIKSKLARADDRVKARYEEIYPWDADPKNLPVGFCDSLGASLLVSKSKFSGSFLAGEYITTADRRYAMRILVDGQMEDTWLSPVMAKAVVTFGEATSVELRSSWAHFFTAEGDVISVRKLLESNYPLKKIYSLFSTEGLVPVVSGSMSKEFKDVVSKAMVFSEAEEDGAVAMRMAFTPGQVEVFTSRKDTEYHEVLPGEFLMDGEDVISLTVDGMALKQIMSLMSLPSFIFHSGEKGLNLTLTKSNVTAVIAAE